MIRAKEEKQNEKKFVRNDRLIAIASETHIYNNIKTINDLDPKFLEEVEHFFITYSEMEGKLFEPKGRFGPKKTIKCIQLLNEAYNKNMLK